MLKELHISNYRLFNELTIHGLGQVNLIAGKNNTGKTALLEALRIWAAKGDSTVVNQVLKVRGQFTPSWDESFAALFNKHKTLNDKEGMIFINNLKIKRYFSANGRPGPFGVEDINDKKDTSSPLTSLVSPDYPRDSSVFLPFVNQNFPLQALWDKIVLTSLENDVLGILKITEPKILRIDVKEDNSRVLLEGDDAPVPLKSLGDGISRLLLMAVALVSAKDSLLLIDEFEAGLHHSVQEMLWEKIFFYAQKWNIQVFVTTHSLDAVRTFFSSRSWENQGKGKFFRLQRSSKDQLRPLPTITIGWRKC
ncbi:MAG: AAA family ATPase [Lewinellaceae bacterium]|nr:AAA family ATPase [Lewinellaceae bacterium]